MKIQVGQIIEFKTGNKLEIVAIDDFMVTVKNQNGRQYPVHKGLFSKRNIKSIHHPEQI